MVYNFSNLVSNFLLFLYLEEVVGKLSFKISNFHPEMLPQELEDELTFQTILFCHILVLLILQGSQAIRKFNHTRDLPEGYLDDEEGYVFRSS